jgi:hypothetical protein
VNAGTSSPVRLAGVTGATEHRAVPSSAETDEYRKQAEDARQFASRALKAEDKAFWLRLADDWQKLAEDADRDDEKPRRERPP